MKKLFVLLLALSVFAGAVFAQATVNGYIRSWATLDTEAQTFSLVNRLRLNLGWKSEDGNVIFGARVQNDGTTFAAPNYMYGTIKLADGKVAISGGKLWNFDWDIASGYSDYFATGNVANTGALAGTAGMLFQVMPMDALNIGLAVKPDGTDLGIDNFGFYAKYALEGIGNIVVAASALADPFDTSTVDASFQLTMVEGLTASLGYKGLASNGLYAIVTYEADALAAEVATEFDIDNSTFYLEGYVTYTMDAIKLGASFGLDNDLMFLSDTFWFGGEVYYTVGKGQLVAGAQYGETSGFSIPLIVKVSF